jgi:hypothetical protein
LESARTATLSETKLWSALSGSELLGIAFRRQLVIGQARNPAKSGRSIFGWAGSRCCASQPLWYFFGVPRSALARDASVARTIRFPAGLRDKLTADAERCGRSFESQVIALLRRHYGEDVDIAPSPTDILSLATASLGDVSGSELHSLIRKLKTPER